MEAAADRARVGTRGRRGGGLQFPKCVSRRGGGGGGTGLTRTTSTLSTTSTRMLLLPELTESPVWLRTCCHALVRCLFTTEGRGGIGINSGLEEHSCNAGPTKITRLIQIQIPFDKIRTNHATHVNLQEGEVLVVEKALEHLQQRRQLVGLLLPF